MRQQVTIYLPDELYERFKHESVRQGVSLSAYVTRQLATTPSQLDQLQHWLASRLISGAKIGVALLRAASKSKSNQ